MDPTNDPNFTPPSLAKNIIPPAPSSRIPSHIPIEPFVLADLGNAMDAPTPHPSKNSKLDDHNDDYHSKIPRKHSDLVNSSSDEDINTSNTSAGSNLNNNNNNTNTTNSNTCSATPDQPLSVNITRNNSSNLILPPTIQVKSSQIADLEEVPHGIQRQARHIDNYTFPSHRLATSLSDETKYPLVIVACGSFSPITYLHLRMFEMALDAISEQTKFEVIGGYYSPVSSNYKKQGLAPAHHRVRMCELACERTSSWLMVDAWESLQPKYTRTALVLDHFNEEINIKRGGIINKLTGERRAVKIMLLAGGDLIESMGEPDVWEDVDLHHILGRYGCLIVERTGSDVRSFLLSHDIMYEHRRNVLVIKQLIYNDISSTKIRLFIRRGMSVQYLLPNSVIRYIQQHKLYYDSEPVKQVMSDKAD
ncbi:NAD(+) salvage pathway [Scheffersomyces coipomensis]|uniref:NAD(+) salvage pathway n=1 Tax=Scheffersomyces coipomensis TaxID=1788519 RepID=UPI00315D797F